MSHTTPSLQKLSLVVWMMLAVTLTHAGSLKGKVTDRNQEALVGAHIVLQGKSQYAVAGLDGSFAIYNIEAGSYTVVISFIGYKPLEATVAISGEGVVTLPVVLEADSTSLDEIVVTAQTLGGTDAQARFIERTSPNTMNIISAKAIALSPDVSVANVVQRVSGLSVERNSNGDPQYAIVRGMDKRYSYTLVNGVKIPSPDNKNRYIPLDIFPASLLDRLEVYKSLTADMEGDAVGGAINMVMKSAPEEFEVKGDLQVGYNYINVQDGFNRYKSTGVAYQTPREKYGEGFQAQATDFTKKNLEVSNIKPMPDLLGSLSIGNRFLHNRLGVMVGGSFQNTYRGTNSLWFDYDTDRYGANLPSLRSVQDRRYSTHQLRGAFHTRVDYKFAEHQVLKLYSGYYKLVNHEAREIKETYLDGRLYDSNAGNAILSYSTRTKNTDQGIFTTSLQGDHRLASPLTFQWTGVYSQATNDQPDNARFMRDGGLNNFVEQPQTVERRNTREWTRNTDTDLTGYGNFIFQPAAWGNSLLKAGGMYRNKKRDAYYNIYYFDPNPSLQTQGVDWNTYSDVTWEIVNPAGSATDEKNYKANENIFAYYLLGKIEWHNLEVNAGARVEHTDQGYVLKYPKTGQTPDSSQRYTDVLPSLSAKYKLAEGMNLRLTYYKAVSRPGFFEIVPSQMPDDGYAEYGNPALKRTKADNIDLRWEKFSGSANQLLVGVFYKRLQDPIEYALVRTGVNNTPVMQPNNFGTAQNMGLEMDFTHYFNKFGIKINYTYTRSHITTSKVIRARENPDDQASQLVLKTVNQTRPLQGQANHIGNVALLYKDTRRGWESQLSMVYTGERLELISPFLDNDLFSKPIVLLDFALEKRISKRVDVFLKATNLLNSAYQVYIKKPIFQEEGSTVKYPYQDDPENKTLIRRDQYYQSFRLGVRVLWNKSE
ncbi:TonB-dependent receptor [Chryseolinea lacunae]|uniref:TonB-dependent receptor n=1 Tax=Chryseolinea lacunae TaxID=2801331 RepID=A0ABS1KZX7_9BACT|nr:TonB-dependent receptor [Chryseolinea lacunae]MBL0744733.1 TonB-dependent receptor [Chryseolinea lacunae]